MNLIKLKSYNKITHKRQINLCSRIYCKNFLFNIMYNKISATLSYDHVLGNYTILKQSDNDLFRERLSEKVHATILKGIVGVFKKFKRIGTKGLGNVFASAKRKQQK